MFAVLLFAGCLGEAPEENMDSDANGNADSNDNTMVVGSDKNDPVDKSGTITTGSFEQCIDQCSSGVGSGEYCEDGCRFEKAENTKDVSVCHELDQKESIPECYGTVAIAAGDINICDQLSDQEDRNHCVAAFSPR